MLSIEKSGSTVKRRSTSAAPRGDGFKAIRQIGEHYCVTLLTVGRFESLIITQLLM